MGSESSSRYSQEDYDSFSLDLYNFTLQQPCLLPDIGLDESLLKYSGINSNAVLQTYSDGLVDTLPGYVSSLGSALGPLTSVPNAVGLGALVISMIIEICIKSSTQTPDNTYSMLQRVFGEEKASSVRDTMSEYLRRHRMFINNDQRLRVEIQRLEAQLSNHLTILRNSLLQDGQMSSRGFKIWVNGASFHLQMLIHEARLNTQTGKPASRSVNEIEAAINLYLLDLDNMLEKYKTFKISSNFIAYYRSVCGGGAGGGGCSEAKCYIENDDKKCMRKFKHNHQDGLCGEPGLMETYMNNLFTKYEPISGLKSHFSNIKQILTSLISQHGSFTLT